MTAMELYSRFMLMLAIGMTGLGVLLTTLFTTIFSEWDPIVALDNWWFNKMHARSRPSMIRAEDILTQMEIRYHDRYGDNELASKAL